MLTSLCKTLRRGSLALLLVLIPVLFVAQPGWAGETEWLLEFSGGYRDSDDARFAVNFPFGPDQIPAGQDAVLLQTVDPGSSAEFSSVTIELRHTWDRIAVGLKLDYLDLNDRNPTSSAEEYDLDELWLRFGTEPEPAIVPERTGFYAKIGKFPRFERQDDRHLESYGLATTTFNRLEDVGLEIGADLGRFFFVKGSYTQGNPLFMRDPNALAGDNGTEAFNQVNPDPEFGSGIPIPYDADIHDVDFEEPEVGLGVGGRYSDDSGNRGFELLLWRTERKLQDTVAIDGSFYGGDLDLLLGPLNLFPFPVTSNDKTEDGVNLWVYVGGFSAFAQVVDQDLAGLPRSGFEAELGWHFDLPIVWSAGERQILPSIAPAIRYSNLDADFSGPAVTPSPSFSWDWEKWDYGLRIGLFGESDLTLEYSDNSFTLASGRDVPLDELLATLRIRFAGP